jgi:hypothetical protein
MPSVPPEITLKALLKAKTDTLKWWVVQVNEAAKSNGLKNPLTKARKKPELERKIAGYYGLDLSVNAVVSLKKAPPSLNKEIQERCAHMR